MGFFRRLFGGGAATGEDRALHLYVKCNRCGSGVHVRVDLNNDLSLDDEGEDGDGYLLAKEVMDDRCFRLMRAEVRFNARKQEVSRQIEGGTFITAEAYEALRAERAAKQQGA